MKYLLIALTALMLNGCWFTDSALIVSKEQTARIESGNEARAKIAKSAFSFMKEANKDCGTQMVVEDGKPAVTVKPCMEFEDAVKLVQAVPVYQAYRPSDVLESGGRFIRDSMSTLVPLGVSWLQFEGVKSNNNANVLMNRDRITGDIANTEAIFSNFQNTTSTSTLTDTSTIDTSSISTSTDSAETINTSTTNTENVPSVTIDGTTDIATVGN